MQQQVPSKCHISCWSANQSYHAAFSAPFPLLSESFKEITRKLGVFKTSLMYMVHLDWVSWCILVLASLGGGLYEQLSKVWWGFHEMLMFQRKVRTYISPTQLRMCPCMLQLIIRMDGTTQQLYKRSQHWRCHDPGPT